jgi:hypothetical protein
MGAAHHGGLRTMGGCAPWEAAHHGRLRTMGGCASWEAAASRSPDTEGAAPCLTSLPLS